MNFRIYHDRAIGIRDRLVGRRRKRPEEFLALRNVNIEVQPGETVALIGPNGSGKSTLLKCIARIMKPTSGEILLSGQTAALLELGAGFHGDLTGRENVYLNASILGFARKRVDEIFDEIVAFAELEDFIDTPVRNYSSGMYVRLGFAVAVNLSPEIFLVDEVLAVGDARFQQRCFDRIRQLQRSGTTIVLVTHDLDAAANICRTAVLLNKGEVVKTGVSHLVVDAYRDLVAESGVHEPTGWTGGPVHGSGEMTVTNVRLESNGDDPLLNSGDEFAICFDVETHVAVEDPVFGMIIRGVDGTYLFDTNTLWRHQATGRFDKGQRSTVRFELKANILSGLYLVTVAASNSDGRSPYDWHTDALAFEVRGPAHSAGVADLGAHISVRST